MHDEYLKVSHGVGGLDQDMSDQKQEKTLLHSVHPDGTVVLGGAKEPPSVERFRFSLSSTKTSSFQ